METGTIGSRIRKQRERINYTQAQMAEKLGITARTQRNYETGARIPDASYLAALAPLGVDINYVLNGDDAYNGRYQNDSPEEWHVYVSAIKMAFGISHIEFEEIIDKSLVNDDTCGFDPAVLFVEFMNASSIFRLLVDRYAEFDQTLLSSVLQGIDDVICESKLSLTNAKKAQTTAMLYRTFKANGKLDKTTIQDTVKLAAS